MRLKRHLRRRWRGKRTIFFSDRCAKAVVDDRLASTLGRALTTRRAIICIRTGSATDARLLPDIERAAGTAFRNVPGLAWIADPEPVLPECYFGPIDEGSLSAAVDSDAPVGLAAEKVGPTYTFAKSRSHPRSGVKVSVDD